MAKICQRKCSAILWLLLPLLMVALIILIPWYHKIQFYDQTAETNIQQIQRYHRVNQSLPQLRQQLSNPIVDKKAIQKQYIDARTPALAAAKLQRTIKRLVNKYHATLESTQNISRNNKKSDEIKIKIKTRMKGDISTLSTILYDLESGSPSLFVDNLVLRLRGGRKIKKGTLSISFELYGYQQVKK